MARAALSTAAANVLDVNGEAVLAQAAREFAIVGRQPHAEDASRRQRRAHRVHAAIAVEPAVGRSGQRVGAVVDVEQDGIESSGFARTAPRPRRFLPPSRADRRGARRQAARAARDSSRRPPARAPRQRHVAVAGSTSSAARSVKPMPRPPIRTRGRGHCVEATAGERRQRVLRTVLVAAHERLAVREKEELAVTALQRQHACRREPPTSPMRIQGFTGFFRAARYVRSRSGTQVCTAR